ncbi:peptidase S8/S53 domain-containing protein [Ustulina deusta]|nr:peptidase S8/S53 domain-containing protein [Ustulina deusta]
MEITTTSELFQTATEPIDHADFGGRASSGANLANGGNIDGAGHGTFIAGIVGSNSYGVAKKTQLLAIKVSKNDGTADGNNIVAAIDWVAGRSQVSNDAVAAPANAGTFVAVASGNDNADAESTSSAVCSVSASDENDAKAESSTCDSVVDILGLGYQYREYVI